MALVGVTLPKAVQLPLPRRYSQWPLPSVVPTMTMPVWVPVSTSAMAPRKLATVWPALAVSSSVSAASTGAAGVSTGASFTAVTSRAMVAVAGRAPSSPPSATVTLMVVLTSVLVAGMKVSAASALFTLATLPVKVQIPVAWS